MRRSLLTTTVAVCIAVLGALNLALVVEWHQFGALRSPDAWLPLTAALAGWLVLRLAPDNALGWVLLGVGASSALFGSAALVVAGRPDLPAVVGDAAAWLSAWVFLPSYWLSFLVLPLLFPDGRPPGRIWRGVLVVALAVVALESILLAFGSRESIDVDVANPLRWSPVTVVLDVLEPAIWVSMPVLAMLGLGSLVHRWIRAKDSRPAILAVAATLLLGLVFLVAADAGVVLGLLLPLVIAAVVARSLHDELVQQRDLSRARARDLADSRTRLVQAHDAARRRIERDLHDGTQQQLLALSVGLGRLATRSDDSTAGEIARLQDVASRALGAPTPCLGHLSERPARAGGRRRAPRSGGGRCVRA